MLSRMWTAVAIQAIFSFAALGQGKVVVSQLVTAANTSINSTTASIIPVPQWTLIAPWNSTDTRLIKAGTNLKLTADNCHIAGNPDPLIDNYYTVTVDTMVTLSGTFFGNTNDPGPWCTKFLYQDTSNMSPVQSTTQCTVACIMTVSSSDPLAAIRLSSLSAGSLNIAGSNVFVGMLGAYIDTLRMSEVGSWAQAYYAYKNAITTGGDGIGTAVTLRLVEQAIAQSHGCRDKTSYQIIDGYFIYITNGTPLVITPSAAVVPASK